MKDSLVAINIINNDKILNNKGVPLLFYWDGQNDVLESMHKDNDFRNYLFDLINTTNFYTDSKLTFFYFKYENDKEQYNENIVPIQDFLKLEDFPEDKLDFYKEYIWIHFAYLYKSVFQEDYAEAVNMLSIEDSVLNIYDLIKEKHPKRVIKSTVLNYIRSELMKTNHLNMENTNWIINKLETLLNEKE